MLWSKTSSAARRLLILRGPRGAAKQESLEFWASTFFRAGWCQTRLLWPNLPRGVYVALVPWHWQSQGWLCTTVAVRQGGKGCDVQHLFLPPPCQDPSQPVDFVTVFCMFPVRSLSIWTSVYSTLPSALKQGVTFPAAKA